MDNFKKCDLEFEDMHLNIFVSAINSFFERHRDNFVYICRDVYNIWKYCKGKYWKTKNNEYYNSYQILAQFGFDTKSVSRYKNCYEKFIVDNKQTLSLAIPFLNFSPSKLFEMLPLSQELLFDYIDKKLLRPEMTVKEIREFIKSLKDGTDKAEKELNEEDIPLAYDPKQEYEYSYFENKTKNQLLNIVWELQKAYQKLKLKGEKNNVK